MKGITSESAATPWRISLGFLGAFAKLRKATLSLVISVRPHWTTRLPLNGFSWTLISEYFSKLCQENSSFIKIWQEWRALYVKKYVHLRWYAAKFFLVWEILQPNVVQKIKILYILCSITFFYKSCRASDKGKIGYSQEVTDDNIIRRMRSACWKTKATAILKMCNTYFWAWSNPVTSYKRKLKHISCKKEKKKKLIN